MGLLAHNDKDAYAWFYRIYPRLRSELETVKAELKLAKMQTRTHSEEAWRKKVEAAEAELEQVRRERDALKLSTCSTLWWEDGDTKFDSPENYAEERGLKIGDEFELQGAR